MALVTIHDPFGFVVEGKGLLVEARYDGATGPGDQPTHIGWAHSRDGAVVVLTDPVWKICRIVYSGDNFVRKLWADGNTKFDNVMADYLTLDYKSPV